MNVGKLNRQVVIEQPGATQDAAGQPTAASWTTLATVYANIRYMTGSETVKAEAPTANAKVSIRIRRRTDVTAAMRVTCLGVTYQILTVLPDETSRDHLDLVCEVVGG